MKMSVKLKQMLAFVSENMDEMSTGAKEINKSAENVSRLADSTLENIKDMDDVIGKFKV